MKTRDLLILLVVCLLVFWVRLGHLGLIDPDEPFYALTAQEMLESGDWVTPQIFGEPQFEEPIFFYWLTALSFKTFGITEWAARAPSALPATLLVFLVYAFAARRLDLLLGASRVERRGHAAGMVVGQCRCPPRKTAAVTAGHLLPCAQ